jgi:hypothetical protein
MSDKPHAVFGWGAPPFKEQFPQMDDKTAHNFDLDNAAIIRLHIHGVLTDSQRDSAIRKVTKRIEKVLIEARSV